MDEKWKEITLSSFHHHLPTPTSATTATALAGFQLQDFMPIGARPSSTSSTSPSPSPRVRIIGRDMDEDKNTAAAVFKRCTATALGLNSWSDMLGHGVGSRFSVSLGPSLNNNSNSNYRNGTNSQLFEILGTSYTACKKRVFQNGSSCDDKRHKRLMKNRESAARSRARKQAHTNELKIEAIRLQKENARLRRQVQQLLAAAVPLPKKPSLRRTLTAPL